MLAMQGYITITVINTVRRINVSIYMVPLRDHLRAI